MNVAGVLAAASVSSACLVCLGRVWWDLEAFVEGPDISSEKRNRGDDMYLGARLVTVKLVVRYQANLIKVRLYNQGNRGRKD